jgi:hypothetical protein
MYKFIFSALHCQVSRLTVVKKSTNPGRLAIIQQFRAFYQLFKVKDNRNLSQPAKLIFTDPACQDIFF